MHALRFTNNEPFITVNCGAVTASLFEREFFGYRNPPAPPARAA
ncbi:sigma 54-interacting transcriptional regulator [Desulfosarcina cetonica]